MHSVTRERKQVNGREMLREAMAVGEQAMLAAISQRLNELLLMAVTYLLGRAVYVRRADVRLGLEQTGMCKRCKDHHVHRFLRNGYRPRALLTPLGWVDFALPRVRCVCGGSVSLGLEGLLRPYQRLSDETDEQIRRWYRLGQSLRQLQRELSHSFIGPLSLQTLLTRVHQLPTLSAVEGVPPLIQVDAIWVTQLRPNGRTFLDRKGRSRQRKSRVKRPVFIALGVWPQTDQALVLDWMLASSENADEWERFLSRLEEAGYCGENGLQLVIHDGGTGLCSALQTVRFDAHYQRCLFHKLRNIANAIHLPPGLSRRQRTRQRKREPIGCLKHFREIWQAKRLPTALRRYLRTVRRFRHTQPDAVAALRRDFRHTLSFYHLSSFYELRHLRTTSRLERFNRTLRSRLRPACALHSEQGLIAMISQQIQALHAI